MPKRAKSKPRRYFTNRKCLGCGKPRSRWPADRKDKDTFSYCSDNCKTIKRSNDGIDRRTDPVLWKAVMKRDGWKCRYCGEKAEQVDHIIPHSKGGPTAMSNLVAACFWCNVKARDRVFESFVAKREWLLKIQHLRPEEPRQVNKKFGWQAWVYGGMKSLKNKRQKS